MLNRLFGSTEAVAKEIELDENLLVQHWEEYLKTVSKRRAIVKKLTPSSSQFQNNLRELKKLLETELAEISGEEKTESELIADVEQIEHVQKIKRVHKLEQCLGYAETKYEYVYSLLQALYPLLKIQMHVVEKLETGSKNAKKLISKIQSQCEIEGEIIKKIENIGTFHTLFLALVNGEHIISSMNAREKKLLKRMQKGISKIFSNEITKGITYEWAMNVFNAIEDKVHEGVANGMFPAYHPDIDFQFVNRPEFVDLVRLNIQILRKRKVSEQMIAVFVQLFREWYNHERG